MGEKVLVKRGDLWYYWIECVFESGCRLDRVGAGRRRGQNAPCQTAMNVFKMYIF